LFITLFFLFDFSPTDIERTGAADGNGTMSAPISRFTLVNKNNLKMKSFMLQREDCCQCQSDGENLLFQLEELIYKEE
jgi:hypothetical protein